MKGSVYGSSFKKRLSTSSPRPRQIAVFWERIGCEVLMGPKDNNHGDISTSNPDSSVAPGRVWRQTAEGWVGGHHMHIKSHYIIQRLKAHSLLTLQGPDEAGATLYSPEPDGWEKKKKNGLTCNLFFFHPFFFLLRASLVFLESRLNSTQDYNLVGRLGGREENHLATIAAAEEGRIWNSHCEGGKEKKKKTTEKNMSEHIQQRTELVGWGEKHTEILSVIILAMLLLLLFCLSCITYTKLKEHNRGESSTSPFQCRAGNSTLRFERGVILHANQIHNGAVVLIIYNRISQELVWLI